MAKTITRLKSVDGVKVVELPQEGQPCGRCICVDCVYGKSNGFGDCPVYALTEWPCGSCEAKSWIEDCKKFKNRWGEKWKHPTEKWLKENSNDWSMWSV